MSGLVGLVERAVVPVADDAIAAVSLRVPYGGLEPGMTHRVAPFRGRFWPHLHCRSVVLSFFPRRRQKNHSLPVPILFPFCLSRVSDGNGIQTRKDRRPLARQAGFEFQRFGIILRVERIVAFSGAIDHSVLRFISCVGLSPNVAGQLELPAS